MQCLRSSEPSCPCRSPYETPVPAGSADGKEMGILCGRRDKEESSAPSTNRRTRSVRVSLLRNVNTATVAVKPVGCDLQQLALVLAQVSRPLVAVTLDKLQQGFRQRQPSVSLVDRHAENLPAALGHFLPGRFHAVRPAWHRCRWAERGRATPSRGNSTSATAYGRWSDLLKSPFTRRTGSLRQAARWNPQRMHGAGQHR